MFANIGSIDRIHALNQVTHAPTMREDEADFFASLFSKIETPTSANPAILHNCPDHFRPFAPVGHFGVQNSVEGHRSAFSDAALRATGAFATESTDLRIGGIAGTGKGKHSYGIGGNAR